MREKDKFIVSLIFGAILSILVFGFVHFYLEKSNHALIAEQHTLQYQINQINDQTKHLPAVLTDITALRKYLISFNDQVTQKDLLPFFVNNISAVVKQNGIKLNVINPTGTSVVTFENRNVNVASVDLGFETEFRALGNFIEALEKLPVLTSIDSIMVRRSSDNRLLVQMKTRLYTL